MTTEVLIAVVSTPRTSNCNTNLIKVETYLVNTVGFKLLGEKEKRDLCHLQRGSACSEGGKNEKEQL